MNKCKVCGQNVSLSNDGWTTYSIINKKLEVKVVRWYHVVGHNGQNGKFCKGSGEVMK